MNFTRMVMLRNYFEGGRYERYQRLVILKGPSVDLPFYGYDWTNSGSMRAFGQSTYKLLVDGVQRASVNVSAGAKTASFSLDLASIPEGWHELDIVGAADETCPQMPVYVQHGGTPINGAAMPVSLGTYGLIFDTVGVHFIGTVPARYFPTIIPLSERSTPAFATALKRPDLVQTQLVPSRPDDIFRPSVNEKGLLSTANTQAYFWSDFVAKLPRVSLLDGPRGRGCVKMPTHLQVGRNATYFCDPWRVGKISADGTVTTLVGYRHRQIPSLYAGPQDLELVGDWSAIPADRRGFHELWGMAWDQRTLAVNESAAPIAAEHNDKPHLVGPVMFLADTQNNRICKVQFHPSDRSVPGRVTEFITGLADPWDVICEAGVVYVSERLTHRITAFDASTGARLRTVLQGANLSGVNSNRMVFRRGTLAEVRNQPIVGPEGLYFQDGWLYFGSRAMEQVKRVNVSTGVVETVCNILMDNNSSFAKIAVSDGTFGPRGTVFVAHWSVINYGFPHAYLPNGGAWDQIAGTAERGTPYAHSSYPTAVCSGNGRMIFGSAYEGVFMMSRALPSDTLPDRAKYLNGYKEYIKRGLQLLYGPAGWGYYGLPLPWGTHADIDYYLSLQGHRRV